MMHARRALVALAVALVAPLDRIQVASAGTPPAPPRTAKVLVERLRESGRAEATFVRRHRDLFADADVEVHGKLVLEPPDRARLDFDETSERVTLRKDGGEWLQPQLEQMLRFEPERAWAALRWWRLFAGVGQADVRERPAGDGGTVVRIGSGEAIDSAWVRLAKDGLPAEIRIVEAGDLPVTYALGGWRFAKPRGRDDFVIRPPKGYDVFDLP
jgi:hypothetical protein